MSIVNNIPLEQDIIVDLTESQIEVAYANQYDDSSRQINCHIQNNGVNFPCENYTISLWIKKTNDCGFTRIIGVDGFGSVSNNIVSFPILEEMTYSHGRQVCNLELLQGDSVVYSCVFYLRVNKVGVQQEDILDSDDYKSVHDEFHLLEEKINELGDLSDLRSEIYTDSSTTPTNQEDGDYWTRLLDENGKAERYVKQGDEYKLLSYATSSESVEMTDGTDLQTKINNLEEDISSLDATPDNIVLYADDGEVTEIPDVDNNGTSSNYELPVATADTLGGIKVGTTFSISDDGTLNNKSDNLLSVKSVGCIGDGITNDTVAFKNAIAQAIDTGKVLYIDKGKYLITDRLIINSTINIQGASQTESIIKYQGEYHEETDYDFDYYPESNACFVVTASNCELKDFTIMSGETVDTASESNGIILHYTKENGTQYDAAQRVALTNLDIKGFKNGLFIYAGWNRYVTRCNFINNSENGVKYYPLELDSVGNWAASGDVYIACQFIGNSIAGFWAYAAFETTIWNSVFEYNGQAIHVENCRDTCFKNCWNEANYGNSYVKGSCKFEGGYNITNNTVDHELIGGNDLIIFEYENSIQMCRAGEIIFNQSSGIIVKGVELGAELENLISNPYFSEASGGTGDIVSTTGWELYPTWANSVVDDDPNYLKLSVDTATSNVYYGAWASDIACEGGETYNISAWMMTDSRAAIDGEGMMCYIAWKNSSGTTLLIDNRTITMIGDNTWELKEFTATAPDDATILIIGWGLSMNGTMYLKEPTVTHSDGLLRNNVTVRTNTENDNTIEFYDVGGNIIGDIDLSSTTTIDSELSETSTNPVQNKIIANSIASIRADVSKNSETISTHTSDIALLKHEASITALRGVYSTITFTNYESNNINLTELFGSPVAFLVSSYAYGSASQVISYVVDATVNNYIVKVRDMINASGTYTVGFVAVLYKG